MRNVLLPLALTAAALAATACASPTSARDALPTRRVDIGLKQGYAAQLVARKLKNPSWVTFSPDGELTICDAGNGRVVLLKDGKVRNHITGFATEYWKDDPTTLVRRFQVGPLSAVWLPDRTLAVTDSGRGNGREGVVLFRGAGFASDGERTNGIASTTDQLADDGEGNLTGLVRGPDGESLYLCGQGSDLRTWILRCDVSDRKLWTFASADLEGVSANSPMQCVVSQQGTLLVLYSGTGGTKDGTIVEWDLDTGGKLRSWTLPGLVDPMGMTWIPGRDELALVDNNWALTHVKPGRLARVRLPAKGGAAEVTIVSDNLHGPTSCAFGPDGRLYVAELGRKYDADQGRVIAISGF